MYAYYISPKVCLFIYFVASCENFNETMDKLNKKKGSIAH